MNKYKRYNDNIEIRALEPNDDGEYIIEGYAIIFGERAQIGNWFYEEIQRGALDGADLTDVPLFIHHNFESIPLARSRRNNPSSTLKLTPDDRGLHFRAKLDIENNADAKSLYSAVKRGDISGMSYGFIVGEDEWKDLDSTMPTRTVTKLKKVSEISALWSPAYEGTSIEARGQGLDNPDKLTLDNVRAKSLENDSELELTRAKTLLKLGGKI